MRSWGPKLIVTANLETDQNSIFFLRRLQEAVRLYSASFDIVETIASDLSRGRKVLEGAVWARDIVNSIACEGLNRVGREERFSQWSERFRRVGFEAFEINEVTKQQMYSRLKKFHSSFEVKEMEHALGLSWKGVVTNVVHAWTC